jgi:uncharacterized protein
MEMALSNTETSCSPTLRPDSYYVFSIENKNILLDLRSMAIFEITDPLIFDLLEYAAQNDLDEVERHISSKYPDSPRSFVTELIEQFQDAGLLFGRRGAEELESIFEENIEKMISHRPKRIQLFVSQSCNMQCSYCYAQENGSNKRKCLMDFNTAKKTIDYLIKSSNGRPHLFVMFTGGEPLLNFGVIQETVEYCKKVGPPKGIKFSFQISTNGSYLNEEIQDFIVENNIEVHVSFNADVSSYIERCNSPANGDFDLLLSNVRMLQNKYLSKGRSLVFIRANVLDGKSDVISMHRRFLEVGFKRVRIASLLKNSGTCSDGITFTDYATEQMREAGECYIKQWLETFSPENQSSNPDIEKIIERGLDVLSKTRPFALIGCGIGRNCNSVDATGNIYPCHRYVGIEKFIIGHIDNGLDDVVLTSYYHQALRHRMKKCKKCWARFHCGGGCQWLNERLTDSDSEKLCDSFRRDWAFMIYVYSELAKKHPQYLRQATNYRTRLA